MTSTGNGVGGSLRERRRNLYLTQQQLAELADCSIDYIRLLERNYSPGHSRVWPRILAALEAASPLATRRRAVGLTQQQLARYSGGTETEIAQLEAGSARPDRTTAERIAAALQTSVDVVFPDARGSA
jgi:transcriptional regulator with XRE-family HTH domain